MGHACRQKPQCTHCMRPGSASASGVPATLVMRRRRGCRHSRSRPDRTLRARGARAGRSPRTGLRSTQPRGDAPRSPCIARRETRCRNACARDASAAGNTQRTMPRPTLACAKAPGHSVRRVACRAPECAHLRAPRRERARRRHRPARRHATTPTPLPTARRSEPMRRERRALRAHALAVPSEAHEERRVRGRAQSRRERRAQELHGPRCDRRRADLREQRFQRRRTVIAHGEHHSFVGLGDRAQSHAHLRDDAERSPGAGEQPRDIEARDVLHHAAAGANDDRRRP